MAKGSQSGGINPVPDLLPHEQSYDPEYNWTYEISGRYQDGERRFGVQTTMYYIDWRDTQLPGFPDTPAVLNLITQNTNGIYTHGVEFALDARLLPMLFTELDLSYTDPAFRGGSDDPGSRRFCGISNTNSTSTLCTVGPARSGNVVGASESR